MPLLPEPARMGPTYEQDWPGASARATHCLMNTILVGNLILEEFARLLQPYDLTPSQFQLLAIVDGAGEALPHIVIAQRLLVSRGMVTWLVDALEKRGYVARQSHPSSRRTVLVAVTEAGRVIVREVTPLIQQCDLDVVADMSPEEQDLFVKLLTRMHHRLLRRRPDQQE